MARRRASDNPTTALSRVINEVVGKVEVTKDDIVAVAVVRIEDELNGREKAARKAVRDIEKQIKKESKDLQAALDKAAQDKSKGDVKKLNDVLKSIGFSFKATVSPAERTNPHAKEDEEHKYAYCVNVMEDGEQRSRYHSGCMARRMDLTLTAANKRSIANLKRLHEEMDDEMDKALAAGRELSKLSSFERRAKAKIAEAAMEGTDIGAAMLAAIGPAALPAPEVDTN